jgi:serine O-acetyltransferase
MSDEIIKEITSKYKQNTHCYPSRKEIRRFSEAVLNLLFPEFGASDPFSTTPTTPLATFEYLKKDLSRLLLTAQQNSSEIESAIANFANSLPIIQQKLALDSEALFQGDPAAKTIEEVIATYPGFFAIALYRIGNIFYHSNCKLFARMITECAHEVTGIDIHPGATIGDSFFIDHGTGVVIGETTQIGSHVKIYQGVTLGALSVDKVLSDKKRHPTIEDNVIIYSNATILGGNTTIGHHSTVGGNVWLTESIKPHTTVYHSSELRVKTAKA